MSYFKNRLFIIILAAVLLCSITILSLPSCQSANTDTGNNNDTEEIKGETVTESSIPDNAAADTTEERLYANVPDADYGGYEFKILTFAEAGNPVHDHPDLTAETENGDILNDAVYKRNITIEERFNIRLKEIHSINSTSDLQKSVNTQSDLYDLVGQRMVISLAPITGGYYMNLRELPNLDLTKPWYIQSSVENLTFKGKLFTVYSEMLIAPYCATAVIVFNKKLHSDYGLADPYQMVKDGKWTIDALYEMCKDGSKDLNGDGEMTFIDDQWGFMTGVDVMAAFLFGGGGRISKIQSDGSIDFTLANEKNFDIMDKAFQIIYNDDITMNVHKGNHNQPNPNLAMDKLWMDGRALFGGTRISNIRMWREMDIPFGMLPIPKYDVTQDKYYSVVSPFQAMGTCIPVTATDVERTTIILEAMSAESRYTVQPAYFEVSLKMKQARDNESAEMLDYIFGSTVIDNAMTFNFGKMFEDFQYLATSNNRNIQSFYDKYLPKSEKDVEKFLNFIDG